MGDHVPIGTLVGTVSPGYVGLDVVVAQLSVASTISRAFLRRTDHLAGDVVVASLRNAAGGGGAGIDVTLGDGLAYASAAGSLPIAAGGLVYLRVSSSGASSMNLSGDFELEKAVGVTTFLTNLARVKQWLKIESDTSQDDILNVLIAGVSKRCQIEMARDVIGADVVAELHDGDGVSDCLQLRQWPITNPASVVVRSLGIVVPSTDYRVLADRAWIVRAKSGASTPWPRGRLSIEVDYPAGFSEVPEDLAQAATMQAAYVYRQTAWGGDRLGERGTILDLGGSAQFLTGEWAQGVRETLHARRSWGVA